MVKKRKTPSAKPHPIEWMIGIASSLLVAIMIAIIGYEAVMNSGSLPNFTVARLPLSAAGREGQVRFKVSNTADSTAAAVHMHGEWRRPDGIIETAETTLDYVPARSTVEGAFIFSADPGSDGLSIRAVGYADP